MAAIWESIYSFFSPPASRDSSPQGSPSFFSSAFFSSNTEPATSAPAKTDLPMPPTSAFGAARAPVPSPADSSTSLAVSDRDYFSPTSPYTHRSPSMSSTSTASTTPLDNNSSSTNTATSSGIPAAGGGGDPRPAGPRRSATDVVALDTMSREFPKPAHEPSLDELLARKPGKWSLGHYVKNARERKVAVADAAAGVPAREETDAEERARKFDEVKRDLLRAKEEMMRRGI